MIICIFICESKYLSFQELILAKYIVKEDKLITEFIGSLLKAIVKKKSTSLVKVLQKDPILRKHIKDADDLGKKILKHIEKRKKDDPEYAAKSDALDKLVGM